MDVYSTDRIVATPSTDAACNVGCTLLLKAARASSTIWAEEINASSSYLRPMTCRATGAFAHSSGESAALSAVHEIIRGRSRTFLPEGAILAVREGVLRLARVQHGIDGRYGERDSWVV